MLNLWFILVVLLCWQPIYLVALAIYHTAKGDTYDKEAYWKAVNTWFSSLLGLVFAKPNV